MNQTVNAEIVQTQTIGKTQFLNDFFKNNPEASISITIEKELVSDCKLYTLPKGTITYLVYFENEFFAAIPNTNLYNSITEDFFYLN